MTDQDTNLSQYVNNFTCEPSHYEQKPQILNHLTYIEESTDKEGNTVYYRKRLKAAYKEIYIVMKEIAGQAVCFKTEEYIANMAGCSQETVSQAKKVFQLPFEQLDGRALMTVEEKRVTTTKKELGGEERKINKRPVHVCGINWIWPYNKAFMAAKREAKDYEVAPMKEKLTKEEAELAIERMSQKSVVDHVHNLGAEPKKRDYPKAEPKKRFSPPGGRPEKTGRHKTPRQNPFVKEQDPMAKAMQLSLINQNNVEECFASQHKANEFLEIFGFKQSVITQLFGKYNLHDMLASLYYLKKQMAQGKVNTSITGYYLKTLENRWFVGKPS